jgi:predicted dienelactone hydrolase
MRSLLPWTLALASVVSVACGGGSGAAPRSGESLGPPLAAQAGLPVTLRTETFVDPSRPTPAQGEAPDRTTRTLVTTIARPDGPGPFPLILFSHGFGSSGEDYSKMLRALGSAGYVVAAPDYPLTSKRAPGGPQRGADGDQQPTDATFVIDQILRMSADPSGPLAGAVDPGRIGAAGHSMGAGVTMALGYNSCCRDRRVRAGVLMAAATPTIFRGDYFVPPATPILIIHGDSDETLPYQGGRRIFFDADDPKYFLTVIGGDHSGPFTAASEPAGARAVVAATVDFFDAYLKGRPDGVSRLRADTDQPGVVRLETEAR